MCWFSFDMRIANQAAFVAMAKPSGLRQWLRAAGWLSGILHRSKTVPFVEKAATGCRTPKSFFLLAKTSSFLKCSLSLCLPTGGLIGLP